MKAAGGGESKLKSEERILVKLNVHVVILQLKEARRNTLKKITWFHFSEGKCRRQRGKGEGRVL